MAKQSSSRSSDMNKYFSKVAFLLLGIMFGVSGSSIFVPHLYAQTVTTTQTQVVITGAAPGMNQQLAALNAQGYKYVGATQEFVVMEK
jgi:hypothetical protein